MVAPLPFFFGFFVELLTSALYHGTHHTKRKKPRREGQGYRSDWSVVGLSRRKPVAQKSVSLQTASDLSREAGI
jgi:hypothetical protein